MAAAGCWHALERHRWVSHVTAQCPRSHCPEAPTHELGAMKPKPAGVQIESDRGQGPNCVGMEYPLLMGTPFTSEPHCLGEDSS